MMKAVPVSDAIGAVLGHDVTRIVPGEFKGRAFKKGHVIRAEDVPLLLEIGKEHVYVLELEPGVVHEDEAARRLATAAAGPGLRLTNVCEGRVNLHAEYTGLLKVEVDALKQLNLLGDLVFGTLHSNHRVDKGWAVAGTRIIPLIIDEDKLQRAEAVCLDVWPLIQVKPFASRRVGLVTTGSEVYHGRIEDKFGPVVINKFEEWGSRVIRQVLVSDRVEMTVAAIRDLLAEGAQMIVVTGGMSVDPDDRTPASIRELGAEIVTYGAPSYPGAMFMLGYLGEIPILGLPGCVMYYRTTIVDLVAPRLLAGEKVTREDIAALGHGGFCAGCGECRYPLCGFGKN